MASLRKINKIRQRRAEFKKAKEVAKRKDTKKQAKKRKEKEFRKNIRETLGFDTLIKNLKKEKYDSNR